MKKIVVYFPFMLVTLFVGACQQHQGFSTLERTENLYRVYAERSDFERFLDFYADEMVLEDPILGQRIVGREAFRDFFDWPNPSFRKLQEEALIVDKIMVDGRESVVIGHFTPFQWAESTIESMHFTTLLVFDQQGKIIKQTDWINYPNNLLNYETRKNSNAWIVQ
ncbi:MAG: nuclear transport factor 2 family protein [Bacteroidota bacterium]